MHSNPHLTYPQWRNALSTLVNRKSGLTLLHLGEHNHKLAYQHRLSPEDYFDLVLREELEDMGHTLDVHDHVEGYFVRQGLNEDELADTLGGGLLYAHDSDD